MLIVLIKIGRDLSRFTIHKITSSVYSANLCSWSAIVTHSRLFMIQRCMARGPDQRLFLHWGWEAMFAVSTYSMKKDKSRKKKTDIQWPPLHCRDSVYSLWSKLLHLLFSFSSLQTISTLCISWITGVTADSFSASSSLLSTFPKFFSLFDFLPQLP